ncbi:MAG: OmpA family protein [Phycisphaerales bacterium]|nr:OmpA family protein [Phycisphaerales bacterium]
MYRMFRGVAVLGLFGAMLGGCSSTDERYDLAMQENIELRDRVIDLEGQLSDCGTNRDRLQSENEQLAAAVEQLRGEMVTGRTYDNTGLEGLAGVDVSQRGGDIVVAVAGDVLFDSGKATLKDSAKRSLARIASVIGERYPGQQIRVEGYTDTDPIKKSKWSSNEHLSAERSLAVEQYLVTKGIDNDRIYSAAFGPANSKSTKSASRRVEIVVLGSPR